MDLRMGNRRVAQLSFGNALTMTALLACILALPAEAGQIPTETAYAANQSIEDDLWYVIEQRGRFLQAESALRKRDMKRFRRLPLEQLHCSGGAVQKIRELDPTPGSIRGTA